MKCLACKMKDSTKEMKSIGVNLRRNLTKHQRNFIISKTNNLIYIYMFYYINIYFFGHSLI